MLKKKPSLKVFSRTIEFWFYFFSKILHQSCICGVGIDKGVWMGMEFGGGFRAGMKYTQLMELSLV